MARESRPKTSRDMERRALIKELLVQHVDQCADCQARAATKQCYVCKRPVEVERARRNADALGLLADTVEMFVHCAGAIDTEVLNEDDGSTIVVCSDCLVDELLASGLPVQ